ncbi:interaptin-like [Chironomus tepperi]|uniref:interaptin-like n=1 Tax=Chironomus tepperi TaxID=113505 RepID=UPI00391FB0ED
MRFTKKDIIKLLDNYGRAYFNPSLNGKSKQNFLKIIKSESFPLATVDELREKFDFLYKKYKSFKSGSETKFEYFVNVDKAVKFAHQDYMPQESSIDILSDESDDDEFVPKDDPKIITNKRYSDEQIQNDAKKIRFDHSYVAIPNNENATQIDEIQCEQINDRILQGIESNITNAILESIKQQNEEKEKSLNDSFQSMKNELRSLIQNSTTEIVQTMLKKEKEHRLSDVYVMMKTLLDEQREANEILMEMKTILKSSIGGQKVQYDTDSKRYDLEKNNESLLVQILSILNKDNTSQ